MVVVNGFQTGKDFDMNMGWRGIGSLEGLIVIKEEKIVR